MALVDRQISNTFRFPSMFSTLSHRPTKSYSSNSTHSLASSSMSSFQTSYSTSSTKSSEISEASGSTAKATTAARPNSLPSPATTARTRNSILSDTHSDCTLFYRAHPRRRSKAGDAIRPLPQVPQLPVRPLPHPTGVRKLPPIPHWPQEATQSTRRSSTSHQLTTLETNSSMRHNRPSLFMRDSSFEPEIDWDVIMVEIVRGDGKGDSEHEFYYSDDAESIYTDWVYDE
ncbi:hypothetical protein EV361DRAFT_661058 [Lentinula raphanica]|nr:hypothetical protein EV361DRAFT_661058 [Lentinula raphanica]